MALAGGSSRTETVEPEGGWGKRPCRSLFPDGSFMRRLIKAREQGSEGVGFCVGAEWGFRLCLEVRNPSTANPESAVQRF
jgi:hypothetical protein